MLEEGRRGDDNNSNENYDAGDDEDQVHDIKDDHNVYSGPPKWPTASPSMLQGKKKKGNAYRQRPEVCHMLEEADDLIGETVTVR